MARLANISGKEAARAFEKAEMALHEFKKNNNIVSVSLEDKQTLINRRIQEKSMSRRFTAIITREKDWYVAHCVELGVVSQGKSIEEAQSSLKEAVELYIESFGTDDLPDNIGEVVFYPLEVAVSG